MNNKRQEKEVAIYQEVVAWLESHNGKMPRAFICQNGVYLKVPEMDEMQKYETKLYSRWSRSKIRIILNQYKENEIDKVPEEYREQVQILRNYGLGKTRVDVHKEIIKWLQSHNGNMPRGIICKDGTKLKASELTAEERAEISLYSKWRYTDEMHILHQYEERLIQEIPEEYRERIQEIRGYIGKNLHEEIIEWLQTHNGQMPRASICRNGKVLKAHDLTEDEGAEVKLYSRWGNSKEKNILEEYEDKPIEEVPEEYRERIKQIRNHINRQTTYDKLLMWLESHDGKMPRCNIFRKRRMKAEELTVEEIYEVRLYMNWYRAKEKQVLDDYVGIPIEEIPEEYQEKIAILRSYGLMGKRKRTGQEIGKATFDAKTVDCDNARNVVSDLLKDQELIQEN